MMIIEDIQIDQTCFADIGGNKLGGQLDGVQEHGQIARSERSKAILLSQDMPTSVS